MKSDHFPAEMISSVWRNWKFGFFKRNSDFLGKITKSDSIWTTAFKQIMKSKNMKTSSTLRIDHIIIDKSIPMLNGFLLQNWRELEYYEIVLVFINGDTDFLIWVCISWANKMVMTRVFDSSWDQLIKCPCHHIVIDNLSMVRCDDNGKESIKQDLNHLAFKRSLEPWFMSMSMSIVAFHLKTHTNVPSIYFQIKIFDFILSIFIICHIQSFHPSNTTSN